MTKNMILVSGNKRRHVNFHIKRPKLYSNMWVELNFHFLQLQFIELPECSNIVFAFYLIRKCLPQMRMF